MLTGRPGIDLRDPGLPRVLGQAFDELRAHDPVHALADGVWLLTRHDDVAAILKHRALCGTDIHAVRGYDETRPFGAGTELERFQEGLLINLGAADHRRVRSAFTAPFTRPAVEMTMTELVGRLAGELLDALPDDGEADLLTELARPLPARVFMELFDLPREEVERLLALTHEDTVALDVLLSPELVAAEDLARGQQAMLELRAWVEALARARQAAPGADLMSWLVGAHAAGALTWDDVLTQAMEALAAGTNTTMTLIAGMFEALAEHPGEWDRVRADPVLVRPAVEEALRYVSPALAMSRIALEDFTLRDRRVRAGDVLQCAVLAANRDPDVFDAPHRFDAGRAPNPHLAFGGGVHTCLGAHVARLEARVVLERAARRWRRIEVDPDGVALHPTLLVRTYRSLPVRLAA
jgi:cytochrome P450